MLLRNKIITGLRNPFLILIYTKRQIIKLAYNFSGRDPPPLTINIAVNNVCNAKCKMCDVGQADKGSSVYKAMISSKRNFDIDLFKKLIKNVKAFKPEIRFILVEPLLNKDLSKMISIAHDNGLKTDISTNGYLLEEKFKEIADAGLSSIQISIDGPPKIHNKIRGMGDAFEKAIGGIKALSKYSKKVKININYTINNLNCGELINTLEILKGIKGINWVKFNNLFFVTRRLADEHNKKYGNLCPATPNSITEEINPKKMNVNVLYSQIKEIKRNKNRYKFKIKFAPNINYTLENLKRYYFDELSFLKGCEKCAFLYNSCYISTEGNVRINSKICHNILIGNIKNKSFMEIWNSKKYISIRKCFYKKIPPVCSRCCGVMFNN